MRKSAINLSECEDCRDALSTIELSEHPKLLRYLKRYLECKRNILKTRLCEGRDD